ncbi:hypothetical protein [Peribacillus frigoritolerans]|uniref:hypothetical protein n=1 Tax=Peribacillus frigoritolerans TaxID=450367 RepID=UPI002E1AE698|nr:hypothetical protein [Peribacillus frigoritolerans]MED3845796.1 hypothetical protein [Peribacillus frigoritolerans]
MNKLNLEFFFCYDRMVMMYLKGRGFKFITCALHEVSKNKFWLFVKTPELEEALESRKRII